MSLRRAPVRVCGLLCIAVSLAGCGASELPDGGNAAPAPTSRTSTTSSGSTATASLPTAVTWRTATSDAVPTIVAIDPAIDDLIVIEDGRPRPLHVLDAVPNRSAAHVFGAIAISAEQTYFTVWQGDPATPSIWKVPLAGGRATKFADNAANPAVSVDGQLIAFGAGVPVQRLVVRELATGRERSAEVGRLGTMRWAPDGQRIAITSWGEDASFVRIVDVDATGLRVGELWGNRALGSPVWLDNTSMLATDANGGGANAPPFIVDVSPLGMRRLEGLPYFTCVDVSRSTGRLLGIVQQGTSPGDLQISRPNGQIESLSISVSYAQWAA
ncbi:MAG: hypothetical protein ABI658_32635 [Acidimicrobiales bacterium]